MPLPNNPFESPLGMLRALWKHRWKAGAAFVGCISIAVAAAFLMPPKFASEAKLFVRLGRETISLDPTATTGETIAVSETREVEINSILDVLKSRAVLEQMVAELTPAVVLADPALGVSPTGADKERAIQKLNKLVDAEAGRRSSVITLRAEGASPELAQQFANSYLQTYLDQHFRVHRTIGSYEFFVQQAEEAEQVLDALTAQLRDAKNEVGLLTIEGHRKLLQDQLSSIATQELTAEAALAASRAKSAELAHHVKDLPLRVVDDEVTGLPNVAGDGMRQKLYELEIRDKELAAKYTDQHALRVALRQQLAEAQDVVAHQPLTRTQSTGKLNRLRENLEYSLDSEQANTHGLDRQLAVLHAQRAAITANQHKLNNDELRLADLERQVAQAEANLRAQTDKREEARINRALDSERITNVNVVQHPTLVLKPISPNKPLFVVGGLMAGLLAALAIALGSEFLQSSLQNKDETEQHLGLPVLIELPRTAARDLVSVD